MAQTDSRAGFRLPWSSERSTSESAELQQAETEHDTTATDWPTVDPLTSADVDAAPQPEGSSGAPDDGSRPEPEAPESPETAAAVETPAETSRPTTARKPSKFLADLTKAMQAAAEDARTRTLTQFQGEAKAYVEQIHGRSSTEAAALRRSADDDVASVREWSKAEIARIREETETRITSRKGQLEAEIEEHTALIEREIERVHGRVSAFEQEMAAFFERLIGEEDPSRFATMAERLPEPPPFEAMSSDSSYVFATETADEAIATETADETATATASMAEAEAEAEDVVTGVVEVLADDQPEAEAETPVEAEFGTAETLEATDGGEPVATDETAFTDETASSDEEATTGSVEFEFNGEVPADFEVDREAAFAAIQAAAEAAASAEVASDAAARAEAVADIAIEIVGSHDDGDDDNRSLGQTDFDAAEAEAAASVDAGADTDEIPVIGDDALAARLAGLLPTTSADKNGAESRTTQVVVVGLVSVASIASFKRHLGRMAGVQSVGVSSGPDGEFLFAVHHAPELVLRDAIPSMPSFQARLTGSGDGILNVTAHDPESNN